MYSKYDPFWDSRSDEIRRLIESAARGERLEVDVRSIRGLGDRKTWFGKTRILGTVIVDAPMAHARSLANAVVRKGLNDSHPNIELVLTISAALRLTATLGDRPGELTSRPQQTNDVVRSVGFTDPSTLDQVTLDPTAACAEIHALVGGLPVWANPADVPFADGLYFFFEAGEISAHARDGRIVRVGNHPRVDGRLVQRLSEHYRSSLGAKNGSVFRRVLGGALIRREDPASTCLSPGPGRGHWEVQDQPTCRQCTPYEGRITSLLRTRFSFRCIHMPDRKERNQFERLLIATIAACRECRPTPGWLGAHAYSDKVRRTGLWNSEHVGGQTLSDRDLTVVRRAVERTKRRCPI